MPSSGFSGGEGGTPQRQKSRVQIHGDGHLRGDLAFRQFGGPAHEAGHANAAFPHGGLVMEERRVAAVALAAVVAGENDERVVGEAVFLQFGQNHAHTEVDALDHGLVNGAAAMVHRLFGDHRRFWRVWRLKRGVDGQMRHIKEEGLGLVIADELHGALVDEVGEVALAFHRLEAVPQRVSAVVVGVPVEVGMAEQFPEVLVEATIHRIVLVFEAEMPFAEGTGGVAG
jgi:hypothetical protein